MEVSYSSSLGFEKWLPCIPEVLGAGQLLKKSEGASQGLALAAGRA